MGTHGNEEFYGVSVSYTSGFGEPKMKRILPWLACSAAFIPLSAAHAQQTPTTAQSDIQRLPPVDIHKKKTEHSAKPKKATTGTAKVKAPSQSANADANASANSGAGTRAGRADLAPASVTNPYRVAPSSRQHTQTFTRKEIEDLHPSDTFDLLTQATGVLVTYQGRKSPYNLTIRGDSNFGYIIDGSYVPTFIAARILKSLPVSAIEQVDVVRDASALTLGPLVNFASPSGALNSGFIVIRTRRPMNNGVEASTSFESYGGIKSNVFTGATFERDGWKGYVAALGAHHTADGPDGYNMWEDGKTGFGKFGVGYGGFFTETMLYKDHSAFGFERARADETSANLASQKWSYDPIDTMLVTSNSRMSWDKLNTTLLTMSVNRVHQSNVLAYYNATPTTVNNERDENETLNLRHRLTIDGTMLEAGAQYVHWYTPTGELFYTGYAREEETKSAYLNAEQKLFGDRVTLDGSIRWDNNTIIRGIDAYSQKVGNGNYQYFFDRELPLATSYSLGASWVIVPKLTATGRYSHTEQGGMSDMVIAAAGQTLDPEAQEKWEFGLTANVSKYFTPTLTYFDTQVANDKIPVSYTQLKVGSTTYQVANWGESDTHRGGFELVAKGNLDATDGWFGKLNYSAGWTRLTTLDSPTDSWYQYTKPRDTVNFSVTEEWNDYFATIALSYVSEYKSNFQSSIYHDIGNFTVVNLNFGKNFKWGDADSKLTLFGRNITDEQYETTNGYPSLGAVYGAEFTVKY
jgi:hypothetical protein